MAVTRETALNRLMRLVRATFQDMRAAGDALHADIGINASQRAVLEHLSEQGDATVPDIARAKNVSRQHIQKIADSLAAEGLVQFAANPGHKRSPFVALTDSGLKTFDKVRAREGRHIQAIAASFSGAQLHEAIVALEKLRAELARETDWRR